MSDYCSDVLIHIDEELDDDYIGEIERDFSRMDGVVSACVHENARHLMLVDYDPMVAHSTGLLNLVKRQGLHAELVGF